MRQRWQAGTRKKRKNTDVISTSMSATSSAEGAKMEDLRLNSAGRELVPTCTFDAYEALAKACAAGDVSAACGALHLNLSLNTILDNHPRTRNTKTTHLNIY